MQELMPFYGADCPAAVVVQASTPAERILRGTLADIAAKVAAGADRTHGADPRRSRARRTGFPRQRALRRRLSPPLPWRRRAGSRCMTAWDAIGGDDAPAFRYSRRVTSGSPAPAPAIPACLRSTRSPASPRPTSSCTTRWSMRACWRSPARRRGSNSPASAAASRRRRRPISASAWSTLARAGQARAAAQGRRSFRVRPRRRGSA